MFDTACHTYNFFTLLSVLLPTLIPPPTTNHRLQLGLNGAAYAFVLSQATSCLLLIAYTAWRDTRMAAAADPQATWSRPSMAVFAGWGTYLSYGVPACLMICMEWWCYEVLILLAGAPSVPLAADCA
jgi:Na+-driven multidrug efflux pump